MALLVILEITARSLEPVKSTQKIPNPDAGSKTYLKGAAKLPSPNNTIAIPPQKDFMWGFEPGSIVEQGNIRSPINSLGIRGEEIAPKAPQELRLLFVGDSSVFGYGVEAQDTFSSRTAVQLSNTQQKVFSAVNAAIPGHSSEQSLTLLNQIGPSINADIVVIANMWSDLYTGVKPQPPPPPSFALMRLAQQWLKPWTRPQQISWIYTGSDISQAPTDGFRVSLRTYQQNLKKLAKKTRALNAKPVFIYLPAPIDLSDKGVPEWIDNYRLVMQLVAKEENALLINIPKLWKSQDPQPHDFFDNVHPSKTGHQKIATIIAQELTPLLDP